MCHVNENVKRTIYTILYASKKHCFGYLEIAKHRKEFQRQFLLIIQLL